ncbi:MAG: hypothetical protein WBN17_13015 [Aureibaculum sp.]
MKEVIYLLLFCCYFSAFSQKDKFNKGEIIDSVLVSANSNESYALYLPLQINLSEFSPIIFIYEPMGRGEIGIHPFIKTADTYGYILVCSNNSKNGPYEQNFEIANRLFSKIFSDFNIHKNRIYTSGFSGGARLASNIANLTQQIQGVVACGAGFSSNNGELPNFGNFSYAAIVGDEDMNFKDMYTTKGFLDRLKMPNELFVYEMNHKWPDQEQILRAFDWMQLEAYNKGIIPTDHQNIKRIYSNYYIQAKMYENENKLLLAFNEYNRIRNNFSKYYKLDSISNKITLLKNNKTYKREKKNLISNFEKETALTESLLEQFKKDIKKIDPNLNWWITEINKLKKNLEKANNSERKMVNRQLYKMFALAIETVSIGNTVQHINQAILCYDICILIYPKYSLPYYKQIENYMNKNNEEEALKYLEKLLNTGYSDFSSLKENTAIKKLKNNKRFQELVKM